MEWGLRERQCRCNDRAAKVGGLGNDGGTAKGEEGGNSLPFAKRMSRDRDRFGEFRMGVGVYRGPIDPRRRRESVEKSKEEGGGEALETVSTKGGGGSSKGKNA